MGDVGYLKVKIEELLKERNISKNKICFDLRIQRDVYKRQSHRIPLSNGGVS